MTGKQIAYNDLLKTPQWAAKRKEILHRDGHRCRNCQSPQGLQVHHRQYHQMGASGVFFFPWNYPNKYLITLCHACHKAGHEKYRVPVFNRKPVSA